MVVHTYVSDVSHTALIDQTKVIVNPSGCHRNKRFALYVSILLLIHAGRSSGV